MCSSFSFVLPFPRLFLVSMGRSTQKEAKFVYGCWVVHMYSLGCQCNNNNNIFLSNCETNEMKKAHGDTFFMPKTMLNSEHIKKQNPLFLLYVIVIPRIFMSTKLYSTYIAFILCFFVVIIDIEYVTFTHIAIAIIDHTFYVCNTSLVFALDIQYKFSFIFVIQIQVGCIPIFFTYNMRIAMFAIEVSSIQFNKF